MCGICGVYSEAHNDDALHMLEALLHRGPDGESIKNFPWGSLGFCRLDIFGPSGVNQPAISGDGGTAVVFNGEIYNFETLKTSLPGNESIRDEAELILSLFVSHGEDGFSKLKGMFAIAVMTPQRLILARDALGIKPLVYFTSQDRLFFASEIRALLRVKDGPIEIDEDALAEASVFGFVFDLEKTMFKGIKQVPPGGYIVYEQGGLQKRKFYDIRPSFYDSSNAFGGGVDRFETLMESSASLYISHSKHPPAVFLSGGMDSSLMTRFLQNHTSLPLSTFTLFDDEESNDRRFAAEVARELQIRHAEFKTDAEECLKWLDHYLFHYESLVTDGIFNVLGSLAFHILSGKISLTHKLAYCGEGADELFGGYYWMHTHPLGFADRLRARARRVNDGKTGIKEYVFEKFPDDDSQEEAIRKEIFDMLMGPGLTNCHLWSVDRSSSAFSIEARPLYLFDDIRDWALSLPIEKKVNGKKTKLPMRLFAENLSPLYASIAQRKKIGMPAALTTSLKELSNFAVFELAHQKIEDRPHEQYSSFFTTDLERFLFDRFHEIFIENRGNFSRCE